MKLLVMVWLVVELVVVGGVVSGGWLPLGNLRSSATDAPIGSRVPVKVQAFCSESVCIQDHAVSLDKGIATNKSSVSTSQLHRHQSLIWNAV